MPPRRAVRPSDEDSVPSNAMIMEENPPNQPAAAARSACTECQRRKQKCNRQWPCNHCQKRKVADQCRFNTVLDERAPTVHSRQVARQEPAVPAVLAVPTAPVVSFMRDVRDVQDEPAQVESDVDDDDVDPDLEALGYSAAHFLSLHNPNQEKKPKAAAMQYYRNPADCSQLEHALQVLPPRPYTDSLIQNFVNVVNFHFYIVHPPSFLKEYEQWWIDRYQNRPLGLPWTSLLLMVCACSAQYPDSQLQEKLQRDFGQTTQKLSERFHTAGRELYLTIPVGNSHLYTVQQLLHSCYWFKSEARYIECWHALTAGIREAQELGIHQETIVSPASELDREMRRRAWCLLSIWDWQIASLLSRSLILDPSECDVQLPNLGLEEYNPSPALFTKLQADIIWGLSRRFGRPTNVTTIAAAEEYKATVERWMQQLPQPYTFDGPDKSMDIMWPWITLHRHHLHTSSLSMALDPIRPYLVKPMSRSSPAAELSLRRDGVKYALKLMSKLYEFFRFIYTKEFKSHSVLFFIFDTAALLCSAVLHDGDHSLPRREDCLKAIDTALGMLKRLYSVTPSAKKPYEMLSRLSKRLSKQATGQGSADGHHRKKARMTGASRSAAVSRTSPASHSSPMGNDSPGAYSSPSSYSSGVSPPASHPHVMNEPVPNMVGSNGAWVSGMSNMPNMQAMQSTSPQYHMSDTGSGFVPSPSSGISGADGSFILSTSPNDQLNGTAPVLAYPGVMMIPEEPYQDLNFGSITEADLGALAGLWDYSSLNLDYVTSYSGP